MDVAAEIDWESRNLESLASDELQQRDCTIADAMSVLGERWMVHVIRELFYGAHQFNQIVGFTGGSRDILADRLRTLEAKGVVERRQYSEHPPRFEYHLTEAGRDLFPVLMTLGAWGAKWAAEEPPTQAFLHDCGHLLEVEHVCASCGRPLETSAIHPVRTADLSD